MADAQDRGWGAPCAGGRTTLVRGDGLRLPVRTELADLVAMLIDLTELGHGYDVLPGQTWGNACRYISGTTVWSNHAWGLAIDINAPANPYASKAWHLRNARGPWPGLVCNMPRAMVEMWEAHGFRWGGRYPTKPDPMHFEFMGSPATCAAITARLRAYLTNQGGPPPPPPEEPMDWDKLTEIVRTQVDESLASRGLTAGTDAKKGGAMGEVRRNLRAAMAKLGIAADQIEK